MGLGKIVLSAIAILLALPSIQKANGERVLEADLTTIKTERKEKARNELLAYDDADLAETDDEINYTVSLKDDDGDQNIMMADLAEEDASVTYDFKYIKALDLMSIDSSEGDTYYGFAYVNDDGEADVQYDFNGVSLTSLDLPDGKHNQSITITTPTIYELMDIGKKITTFDEVCGIAIGFLQIPTLLVDGPLAYLLYRAKMNIVLSQYIVNSSNTQPSGLIDKQSKYSSWTFGAKLDPETKEISYPGFLSDNGCGIIAMYNLLNDSNVQISLPALIAVTQMANADLVLGMFGVSPISGNNREALENVLETFFNSTLFQAIEGCISTVADEIFDKCLSKLPDWLYTVMKWVYDQIIKATINSIKERLLELIRWDSSLTFFINQYINSVHSFADIVDSFCDEKYTSIPCDDYETCLSYYLAYRQMIMTFWNDKPFSGTAHTIYVKKKSSVSSIAYNYNTDGSKSFLTPFDKIIQNSEQYIYGYVWKKKGD